MAKREVYTIYFNKNEYVKLYYTHYLYFSEITLKEIYSNKAIPELERYSSGLLYNRPTKYLYKISAYDLNYYDDSGDIFKFLKIINLKKFIYDLTKFNISRSVLSRVSWPVFDEMKQQEKLLSCLTKMCAENNNYFKPKNLFLNLFLKMFS